MLYVGTSGWQYRHCWEIDCGLLDEALSTFPPGRVAVEFRHESWFTAETRALLEKRRAALCLADSPQRKQPYWRTARGSCAFTKAEAAARWDTSATR